VMLGRPDRLKMHRVFHKVWSPYGDQLIATCAV
jgi:hypothetical protein